MNLKKISHKLTVCKVSDISDIDISANFYFIGRTDEEVSLVCKTEDVPMNTIERDDGWRGFRIQGVLDFSLITTLPIIKNIYSIVYPSEANTFNAHSKFSSFTRI